MLRPDALLFSIAFWAYLLGFLGYILLTALNKKQFGIISTALMIVGVIPHTAAFIVRWTAQGHYPLANMYEYMGMMAWMVVLGMIYYVFKYKNHKIGVFTSPVVVMLLVTASLLPSDINSQLMPALQSIWLTIHVTMAALGSGSFLIAFAAASLYLLSISMDKNGRKLEVLNREWFLFFICWIVIPVVSMILLKLAGWMPTPVRSLAEARMMGLEGKALTSFALYLGQQPILAGQYAIGLGIGMVLGAITWPIIHKFRNRGDRDSSSGSQFFTVLIIALLLSAIISAQLVHENMISVTSSSYFKIFEFFGPTLIVSWFITPIMFYILLLMGGGWIGKIGINRKILEDLSYTSVVIGYPLYTVGALFAGAVWAEQAWGSWWSWDPKEVGALIIWLFYTAFLHARFNRQWKGERAAILVILGMVMVFISFFGNYFFGGLHSFEVT